MSRRGKAAQGCELNIDIGVRVVTRDGGYKVLNMEKQVVHVWVNPVNVTNLAYHHAMQSTLPFAMLSTYWMELLGGEWDPRSLIKEAGLGYFGAWTLACKFLHRQASMITTPDAANPKTQYLNKLK